MDEDGVEAASTRRDVEAGRARVDALPRHAFNRAPSYAYAVLEPGPAREFPGIE